MAIRSLRRHPLAGVAAGLMISTAPAHAAPVTTVKYQFNLPSQGLAESIRAVGRAAGMNLLFDSRLLAGRQAPALRGEMTAQQALSAILDRSGLAMQQTGPRAGLIHKADYEVAPTVQRTAAPSSPIMVAQAAEPPPPAPPPANPQQLEEVTVTATRQASTVNRVPLSISAVTQRTLDQQGVKTAADLQRFVPALVFTRDSGGSGNFSIRGVVGVAGAATTGIYLNDTPLQKRRVNGGAAAGNGSPIPPLFDLERVEVLRGPQGTLYGGSSEGGTIRVITPAPSLTRYSAYARTEGSLTEEGSPSYEGGVAVGGPIVQGKLGFRASIYRQHVGGYTDLVDPYANGRMVAEDSNSENTTVGRVALAWAPTDRALATLSLYSSKVKSEGGAELWLLPQPQGQTYTTAPLCYDTRVVPGIGATPPRTACPAGPLPSYIFQRPSLTYGPYDYLQKPYQSFQRAVQPQWTLLDVYDLTLDYAFDKMNFKSITSYIHDKNATTSGFASNATINSNQSTTLFPAATGFSLYSPVLNNVHWIPGSSKRYGMIQEFRFSSSPEATPFSWVGGIYYSNLTGHARYDQYFDPNFYPPFFGRTTVESVFGIPFDPNVPGLVVREQDTKDTELAVFGEGNYFVTDKLKVTAGVRLSRVQFGYYQEFYGLFQGVNDPRNHVTGITQGQVTESPFTPKVGAQYQLTSNDMVYVSAAKGFRPGGVNSPIASNLCGPALANLGLTVAAIPTTYGSDSIWSYEAGGKFRMFAGRLQLNSSAYRIDWSQLQLTVPNLGSGCGGGWVQNGGKAVSQGFDVDVQARLFGGLTLSAAVGYVDAKYQEPVTLPPPLNGTAATVIVRKGDVLPVPPWQVSIGAQYDFSLTGDIDAYVRGDYTYTSDYLRGTAPGAAGYAADTAFAAAVDRVNARVGIKVGRWDMSLFAKNLFDSHDALAAGGGRAGCAVATGAACTTFSTYDPFRTVSYGRPREVGMQLSYRY